MIEGVAGVSGTVIIDGEGPVSETAATMDGSIAASPPSVTMDDAAPVGGGAVSMEDACASAAPNAASRMIMP
jgi:hypothetical protein